MILAMPANINDDRRQQLDHDIEALRASVIAQTETVNKLLDAIRDLIARIPLNPAIAQHIMAP